MKVYRKYGLIGLIVGIFLQIVTFIYVFYSPLNNSIPTIFRIAFVFGGIIGSGLFISGILFLIVSLFEKEKKKESLEKSGILNQWKLSGSYKEHLSSGIVCVIIVIIIFILSVLFARALFLAGIDDESDYTFIEGLFVAYNYEDTKPLCCCHTILLPFLIMAIVFFKKARDEWLKEPKKKKSELPKEKKCPKCGWQAKLVAKKKYYFCDYCKKKIK